MYVEKSSNPTNSSSQEPTVKLNNFERAIVNYLKLQRFDLTTTPPTVDLVSDVEIAAATQIKGGVPVVKMILEALEKKGVLKRDRYGNWALSDRVNYLLKFKLENSSKLSLSVNSTPEDKKPSIELIARDGKLFARVKDLKKHPENEKIYSNRNIVPLLEKIKQKNWIKGLVITPEGTIISGNSRHECAVILKWELIEIAEEPRI